MKLVDLKSKICFSPAQPKRKELYKSRGLSLNLYCLEGGQSLETCRCKEPTLWICIGGEGHFYDDSQKIPAGYGKMLVCDSAAVCSVEGKERLIILEISAPE